MSSNTDSPRQTRWARGGQSATSEVCILTDDCQASRYAAELCSLRCMSQRSKFRTMYLLDPCKKPMSMEASKHPAASLLPAASLPQTCHPVHVRSINNVALNNVVSLVWRTLMLAMVNGGHSMNQARVFRRCAWPGTARPSDMSVHITRQGSQLQYMISEVTAQHIWMHDS